MTLYLIGLGLGDQKDITLNGLDAIKKCSDVYLENYTAILDCSVQELETLYLKKIILATRDIVESKAEETILKDAKTKDVALLVVGDPLSATTHLDLVLRAKKLEIPVRIIHNSSITSAIAETGLQIYKFGPTASIPFSDEKFKPETPYNIIKENLVRGLHTLILLDLKPLEKKFMTISNALNYLVEIESKRKENVIGKNTLVIGCARIGSKNQLIKAAKLNEILQFDFGAPLHCIVIPGKMHFMEEEAIAQFF